MSFVQCRIVNSDMSGPILRYNNKKKRQDSGITLGDLRLSHPDCYLENGDNEHRSSTFRLLDGVTYDLKLRNTDMLDIVDASIATVNSICLPFDKVVLSDLHALKVALQSPLMAKIPVCRVVEVGTVVFDSSFEKHPSMDATFLVNRFVAFSDRCRDLYFGQSEVSVLTCVTEITGLMWKRFSSILKWSNVFQHFYNKKDKIGASEGDGRPDETDYVNDFLICKSEHRDSNLQQALKELTSKLAHYNHVNYGKVIIFLPVIAAAGSTIELGVVDVRVRKYYSVRRYEVNDLAQRVECYVGMLNCFRLFCTMLPYVPTDCVPLFRKIDNVQFLVDHVKKIIPASCTCPEQLYSLLRARYVPCAVKVEPSRNTAYVNVSPLGLAISDYGEELDMLHLRRAVKSVFVCLAFLQQHDFVHRDIRWSNIIRVPVLLQNNSLDRFDFLVIDFEFAATDDSVMTIEQYKHADVVPTGSRYKKQHDLQLVGKLLLAWKSRSRQPLDDLAHDLVERLKANTLTAATALEHPWFDGV